MKEQDFPKAYEAKDYEDAIYSAWEQSGFFNPDLLSGDREETFSLMMPPPNVTGILHLGHALENSIMDSVIRYQRMRGKRALLLPGTDHAAVATQARVEAMLMKDGVADPRRAFGRDGLLEKIRAYAEASKATILSQIKKMGTSADWSRLAYTFDEPRSRAVNAVFERMFNDGLIYRGHRVVNWSVKGQSTASDDELEYIDRPSVLYTFKYAKEFPFTIATTRPETKLGDTAVAVHPEDERYAAYVGKTFDVVFCGNALKLHVIADPHVDPAFGTGALGVTPAHSAIDFDMYEKQKAQGNDIGLVQVIGSDGKMTAQAGEGFVGLSVEDAREKVVQTLRDQGLMKDEKEIVQSVGTSDRFGDVIEALPMTQWFVDVNKEIPGRGKSLKMLMKEAVAVGHNGNGEDRIRIMPERFEKNYFDWIDNLRDWCISRQIWWGHRIPVWYKGSELAVGETSPGDGWEQDPDTLDTWFSSGLWTFSTLGWPDATDDLKRFHPTSWMQMGYEILFFWMARMILMSTYVLDEIPFREVYIHGILRDKHGKKFSKSLGNGIDPLEVIEQYGTDALRFSLLAGVSPGNDARFYEEKVEGAKHLVNKLWNISRFVLSSVDSDLIASQDAAPAAQTLADRWILAELARLEQAMSAHMDGYELSAAAEKIREFTWSQFADWYVEVSKEQRADEEASASTDRILLYILERLLVMWHPFMPFVTEEIWKRFKTGELLMVHAWQAAGTSSAEAPEFSLVKDLVTGIRNIRSVYRIAPSKALTAAIKAGDKTDMLRSQSGVIEKLARVETLRIEPELEKPAASASLVVGGVTVYVGLEGLIDFAKEKARLQAEADGLQTYLNSTQKKLENKEFTENAPEQIVAELREKAAQAKEKHAMLEEQIAEL